MNENNLNPEVSLIDGERIQYRSQVRFRMNPGSAALVERMRAANTKQVISDDTRSEWASLRSILEKHECWPEEIGDMLILQLTYIGPRSEAHVVKIRHDLMVPAHIRTLAMSHGFAELVSHPEFK